MVDYTLNCASATLTLTGSNAAASWGLTTGAAVRVTEVTSYNWLVPVTVASAFGLTSPAPTRAYYPGDVVAEIVRLTQTEATRLTYGLSLTDMIRAAETLGSGQRATLSETVRIGLAQAVTHGALLMQQLGVADAVTPNWRLVYAIAEALLTQDAARRFFAGSIAEAFGLAQTDAQKWVAGRAIAETIGAHDAITPSLLFRLDVADGVGIHDDELVRQLLNGRIIDGVRMTAAYVAPNGGLTTWVMNTRTGAVTEYTNFGFNSFARMGGRYLAASSAGLFELDGADDAGTSIIAKIRSGYAQFGGARLSNLDGVYLGVRGAGQYVLKLMTGDGKDITYRFVASNMQTTKVRVGKNVRTRYIRFELQNTGQAFDLESIEFVPLIAKRRI